MEGDKVMGLPAISVTGHELYRYFDCGYHLQCFEKWDKKEKVFDLLKESKQKFKNSEYYKEMVAKYGIPKWLEEDS